MIQLLPAEARIRHSRDFSAVLKRGRRAARGGVVVHWAQPADGDRTAPPDAEHPAARAGFVVSKAVGNAVIRNRVKRRLRHATAEQLRQWPPGADVVVRATPKAAGRDFAQLSRDLADAVELARSGKAPRRGSAARRRRSREPGRETGADRGRS